MSIKMLPRTVYKNQNTQPTHPASAMVPAKASMKNPKAFIPQINCRNMGGEGRGSDTTGGGWHMRPSFNPKWTVGDDKDTEIMPRN